nr:hypothetical protein [uncultured Cohaesibacter sp.]
MSQILNWKGLHKEAAEVATAYLRKTQLGQVPSRREIATANETVEQTLPAQALEGNMPLAATPNTNHIDYLLAHPETATDFDAKFGIGSSDKFLELQKNIERETAQKQTDARRAKYLAGPSMMQDWGPIHQQLLENQIIKNR